jgi:hypothetical protein
MKTWNFWNFLKILSFRNLLKCYENLKFLKILSFRNLLKFFLNLMKFLKFYENFELKKKKLFKI